MAEESLEEFVEEREIGIEALMAAATVGAMILGAWFEAVFLAFLFAAAMVGLATRPKKNMRECGQ